MARRHLASLCVLSAALLSAVSSCGGAAHEERRRVGVTGLAGTGPTESPAPGGPSLATWLWESAPILDEKERETFFAFAKEEKVGEAFVHAAARFEDAESFGRLVAFVEQAEKRRIAVTLTAGEAGWALAEQHERALQKLSFVTRVRDALKAKGVNWKARVQFDIEPYTLPLWQSERAALVDSYVRLLSELRASASSSDIELWLVVPFWFDHHPSPDADTTLLDAVVAKSDGIVVMAYRNEGSAIADLVGEELRAATAQNRRLVVAVETTCVKPDRITFCGMERAALRESLRFVDAQLSKSAAYRGLAVHDYEAFRELGRGGQ